MSVSYTGAQLADALDGRGDEEVAAELDDPGGRGGHGGLGGLGGGLGGRGGRGGGAPYRFNDFPQAGRRGAAAAEPPHAGFGYRAYASWHDRVHDGVRDGAGGPGGAPAGGALAGGGGSAAARAYAHEFGYRANNYFHRDARHNAAGARLAGASFRAGGEFDRLDGARAGGGGGGWGGGGGRWGGRLGDTRAAGVGRMNPFDGLDRRPVLGGTAF